MEVKIIDFCKSKNQIEEYTVNSRNECKCKISEMAYELCIVYDDIIKIGCIMAFKTKLEN